MAELMSSTQQEMSMSDEIKVSCTEIAPSGEAAELGRSSFRIQPDEDGFRIDTPSIYTRTHWTRAQLRGLQDALGAMLTETTGGAR